MRFFSLYLTLFLILSCSTKEEVSPLPPSNLVATLVSTNQIDIAWTDNSTNETGFKIERKTGTEIYTLVGSTSTDVTDYSDKGLTEYKEYTYRIYSNNEAGKSVTYSNEASAFTNGVPLLTTASVSSVTASSAISGGSISIGGGTTITVRGVVWSTSQNPSVTLSTKTKDNSGIGSFTSVISGLNWDTKYYIRSYATNSTGTGYGNEISFTTEQIVITTSPVSEVGAFSAISGGTISNNGDAMIIDKGVVWSTVIEPQVTLSTKTSDGIGSVSFVSKITLLNPNTTYFIRAYATNSSQSSYGNEVTFTTIVPLYFIEIAAAGDHSLAIKTDGTLWAWGNNSNGQIGDGTTVYKKMPIQIGSGYSTIAAGRWHSLGIKADGTLWAWGNNLSGELGDGTTVNKNIPTQIGSGYSKITAGRFHSLALKTDGTLWAWGFNSYGQLGDGTTNNRLSPEQIGLGYSAIDAGNWHSLAIKTDGTLWAWGNNLSGELGDGTTVNKNIPTQISSGYSKIAAGHSHSLALKSDGTLWTWGDNSDGQLGDGTSNSKSSPVHIGSGYSSIDAGNHSLGIKTDGKLWAWGKNLSGELGDGTTNYKSSPVQIGSGYSKIAAGESHSLALKTNGILWAWGYNAYGQLGDGTIINKNIPLNIGPR